MTRGSLGVERGQEGPQQVGQGATVALGQAREQSPLGPQQVRECRIDPGRARWSGGPPGAGRLGRRRSREPLPGPGLARGVKRIRGWPGAGAAGRRRAARKELQRLERHIERLPAREKELTDLLAAHASGYTRLVELRGELRGVQAEKARLEEDWLRLAVEGEIT